MTYEEFLEKVNEYNNSPRMKQEAKNWLNIYEMGIQAFTDALNEGNMEEAERIDALLIPFFDGSYKEYYDE